MFYIMKIDYTVVHWFDWSHAFNNHYIHLKATMNDYTLEYNSDFKDPKREDIN